MNDKIKILWVTNAFGCGGAERQMIYMYNILKKYTDFDITILYYAKVGDEIDIEGVKTVFIDKAKIGNINTVREIHKYIKKEKFQIVHAFGGCSANIYGRLGAVFTKSVPIGAMLGKKHFASRNSKIVNSFLNLFGNWWTVNNKELIPILRRDLKFTSAKKTLMLHNGFIPASDINYRVEEKTEFDIDKGDNFIFSTVGRLQPVKNYPLYLKAAKKISEKYENVRFWLVGNGDEYEHLLSIVNDLKLEDKVKFWGYQKDVDCILNRIDAFVQTSFTEGSPNTIAEAMRAGKPIISTNSTDLSEMIINDKNGYIVANDDEEKLVDAMEKLLLKSNEDIINMGEESKKLFNDTFLDVNVVKEFERFYNGIIK